MWAWAWGQKTTQGGTLLYTRCSETLAQVTTLRVLGDKGTTQEGWWKKKADFLVMMSMPNTQDLQEETVAKTPLGEE